MTTIGIDKAAEYGPKDFERLLLRALTSMKKGDFAVRMPVEFTGVQGKIADTLNDILDLEREDIARIPNMSPEAADQLMAFLAELTDEVHRLTALVWDLSNE